MTLLREPVERSLAALRHFKRDPAYRHLSLDQIYDDRVVFRFYVENHQTKVFGLRSEDNEDAINCGLTIDDARFVQAKENLASVDVLGLTEAYGEFIDEIRSRFGWWPTGVDVDRRENASREGWIADTGAARADRGGQRLRRAVVLLRQGAHRPPAARPRGRGPGVTTRARSALAVFVATEIVGAVVYIVNGRKVWFFGVFGDEWDFLAGRRLTIHDLLVRHGDHLVALPALAFRVLYAVRRPAQLPAVSTARDRIAPRGRRAAAPDHAPGRRRARGSRPRPRASTCSSDQEARTSWSRSRSRSPERSCSG